MDTVQKMIFDRWQKTIAEMEDARIDTESAQFLIDDTRHILRDAGIGPVNEHLLLRNLRDSLPMLTDGHPICKQFIEILNSQLETN